MSRLHLDVLICLCDISFINVIMFLLEQMTAGAVTITDVVYWCVIFPFMALKDYEMSFVSASAK